MRILFISTGLGIGGAEVMLVNLIRTLTGRGHTIRVVGFRSPGGITDRLREMNIEVDEAAGGGVKNSVMVLAKLPAILKKFKPDLIQGWMYQGCIAASFFGYVSNQPVAWSLHHSNFDPKYNKKSTLSIIRLAAQLSKLLPPVGITYCGPNSRDAHHRHGFVHSPATVLPNGVDFEKFKPNTLFRQQIRNEFKIDESSIVIGIFANRLPIKDHPTFFQMAARLSERRSDVRFVCCGSGMSANSTDLIDELTSLNLVDRVILAGLRGDVPAVMNACDIIVLTSRGESFPMALTEAVACGVPVVSTDVGDCSWVVGDPARLFTPGDAAGLTAILETLAGGESAARRRIGLSGRARALELFSLAAVTDAYEEFALHAIQGAERDHA